MSKSLKIVISTLIVASIVGSFGQITPDTANAAEITKANSEITGESNSSLLNIDTSLEDVSKSSDSAEDYGLTENTKDGVILHAWCWSFNTIKDNMKDIAEAGYSTVQTSPANNCVIGDGGGMDIMGNGKWYYHYQPTDWKIGNYQLGSRDDFKAMCAEAKKYGVKIIVDVVPNHTTTDLGAVSQDLKNAFTSGKMYHSNGFTNVGDYNNRAQCTLQAVGGLPDVNTEDPGFQKYFLNYLNDLIDCGASGFRYDTAKHIGLPDDPQDGDLPNNFWPVVTGEQSVDGVSLKNKDNLFIYGEILQDANVRETDYAKYISMTASDYGWHIDGAIKDKNFEAGRIKDWCHKCSPDKLVTWVESHDTYCNEGKTKDMTDWQIKMAWAVLAAREGGTPLFYDRPAGAGNGNWWGNNRIGEKGSDLFKDPEVVAVNKFRTAMVGEKENLTNPQNDNQVLMIERGDKGATIINLGDAKDITCATNLQDGTYKDKVSGNDFSVTNGVLTAHLEKEKVACIYDGKEDTSAKVSASSKETEFKTDTLDITLNCKNVTNAKYSIDGGEKKSFKDGDVIKIGQDSEFDTPIKLVIEGTGEDGKTVTKEYEYTKKDPDDCNRAYLRLPEGWEKAYIYVYDPENGNKSNADWPGVQMTKVEGEDNLYYYDIPEEFTKPLIIFNEGGGDDCKKYPEGDKTPGKEITGQMIYDGQTYGKYVKQKDDVKKEIKINNFDIFSDDIKVNDTSKLLLNAEGGNGVLSYDLKITDEDSKEVFSDSGKLDDKDKSIEFVPKNEGQYTAKVMVSDEDDNKQEKEITFTVQPKDVVVVDDSVKINSIGIDDGTAIEFGDSIKFDIKAQCSDQKLSYKTEILDSDGNKVEEFSDKNFEWVPEESGDYKVHVIVKNENTNKKDEQTITVKVNEKNNQDNNIIDIMSFKSMTLDNNQIKLKADADCDNEVTYKFYQILDDGTEKLLQNDKNDNTCTIFTPDSNGTYKFKLVCESENACPVDKTLIVKVNSINEDQGQDKNSIPNSDINGSKDNTEVKDNSETNNSSEKTSDSRGVMASLLSIFAAGSFMKIYKDKKNKICSWKFHKNI